MYEKMTQTDSRRWYKVAEYDKLMEMMEITTLIKKKNTKNKTQQRFRCLFSSV